MGLVITATIGLVIWIVLWSLNVSGFDSILIAIAMVLIVIGLQQIAPLLSGKKDQ
jgi:hypothetical protein